MPSCKVTAKSAHPPPIIFNKGHLLSRKLETHWYNWWYVISLEKIHTLSFPSPRFPPLFSIISLSAGFGFQRWHQHTELETIACGKSTRAPLIVIPASFIRHRFRVAAALEVNSVVTTVISHPFQELVYFVRTFRKPHSFKEVQRKREFGQRTKWSPSFPALQSHSDPTPSNCCNDVSWG